MVSQLREALRSIPTLLTLYLYISGRVRQFKFLYSNSFRNAKKIRFQCNICGKMSIAPVSVIQARETASCCHCSSTLRERSIVYLLADTLGIEEKVLSKIKEQKIAGIGMSDSDYLASRLAGSYNYQNTFYHKAPKLDIMNSAEIEADTYDFVITSEVFEHVPPPVEVAFKNLFKMLKPGGVCLFTVPFNWDGETREHFPDLFEFEITHENGKDVLVNKTKTGAKQRFENVRFHGGDGSTLEMRLFSKDGIELELKKAGFDDIEFQALSKMNYGIDWKDHLSCPITFRKPLQSKDER